VENSALIGKALVVLQERELLALLHCIPADCAVDGLPFADGPHCLRRAADKLALALGDCRPDPL